MALKGILASRILKECPGEPGRLGFTSARAQRAEHFRAASMLAAAAVGRAALLVQGAAAVDKLGAVLAAVLPIEVEARALAAAADKQERAGLEAALLRAVAVGR